MHAQSWTDLLKLLAMMVMSSCETEERHSDMFADYALKLRDELYPKLNLDRELATEWYESRHRETWSRLSSLSFDKSLAETLQNLETTGGKKQILLTLMNAVAAAPSETKSQAKILRRARRVWKLAPTAVAA